MTGGAEPQEVTGAPRGEPARGPATRARAPVHAAARSRLGASEPHQEGPADLRLLPPAAAAWAAAALTPSVGVGPVLGAVGAMVLLAVLAVAWVGTRGGARGGRGAAAGGVRAGFGDGAVRVGTARVGTARVGPVGVGAARGVARRAGWGAVVGAGLAAVVAAGAAGLVDADRHRGPVPGLAERRATAEVWVRISGDPFTARARAAPGRAERTVVVPAEVVRVGGRSGTRGMRTPVVVMADHDAARWLALVPSTTVAVRARLGPPARRDDTVAAVLSAHGPPRVVGAPSAAQKVAAGLRGGLRRASAGAGLPEEVRGLLPGLVIGDTSGLSPEVKEAFKATDLAHLTAVSGANLTIVLLLLIGPPARASRAERRGVAAALGVPLRLTALLGVCLTAGFVLVCRPSASVLRAAGCGLITLLAIGTGRRRSLLPALCAAVLLLVLVDPPVARSYGFALSVLATGSLLTLAPRWCAALRARGVPERLAEALAAAGAAQAVCGPLIVVLAARLSLVAVPCNLLAEPAVAPATVLGFAALVAAPPAPAVATGLAWAAGWPTRWIVAVARHGAALPGAEVGWPGGWPGAALLAGLTLALALGGARALLPLARRPWTAAGLSLALLLALVRPPLPGLVTAWPPDGWRFAMCDVGQGDALALSAGPGSAVVVDTGPDPALADRCLRDLRVRSVPLLVLTHFHADHADGLPGVLRGRSVGAIETTVLDEPAGEAARVRREAAAAGVPVLRAGLGERRAVGALSWRVLWPPPSPDALPDDDPNDASVAMLVRAEGLTLLLAGDLGPEAQEQVLAEAPGLPRVDVLKVAHHGSGYQDPAFLARLHPRLALISVGAHNMYGHPAPRTLTALRALGATVLRTDTSGPIAVTGDRPEDLHVVLAGRI